jgi:iron complex outermembrane recepter protein
MINNTIRKTAARARLAATLLALLGSSTFAIADDAIKHFSIDGQVLLSALNEFGRQSDLQILFSTDIVEAKRTNGVRGDLVPEAALAVLLKGTGLTFRVTADHTILVERPHAKETSSTTPSPVPQGVAASTNNVFALEEVVVTGTAAQTSKFTAPYAVSTIKEQAMLDKAPHSLVDLLRGQPGLYVENSGGEGGDENITIRGLPYAGFRLIDVLQDGLPLFESNYERFLNIDELFRVDLMTEHAEIVRGGTAPIYSNNASGGVVNLIARHGTPTPEGAVQVEFGSNSLTKVSAYQSGPITDNLLFCAGGSYRRDDGLRDQGFTPGNQGGQAQVGATYILPARSSAQRSPVISPIPCT